MAAMRAEDRIVVREMCADARRNGFLADIRMTRAEDQTTLMTTREFLFGLSDDLHRPVQSKGLVLCHWSFVIGHQLMVIHFFQLSSNKR